MRAWNAKRRLTSPPTVSWDELAKRAFDIVASTIGLIVLAPLLAVIAVLIRLDSPGPALYRSIRIGQYGRSFAMLKFRTMIPDAERIGGPSTANDDPRITRVGRLLRKMKLDEAPQLINVLRGEMSIVGPRPEVPQYAALLTEKEQAILSVRPGMTDWASIWNADEGAVLAGSPDVEQTYLRQIRPEKIRLQLEYVRRRSMRVDLQIIVDTAAALLRRRRNAGRANEREGSQ